jgi:hypothetical protein
VTSVKNACSLPVGSLKLDASGTFSPKIQADLFETHSEALCVATEAEYVVMEVLSAFGLKIRSRDAATGELFAKVDAHDPSGSMECTIIPMMRVIWCVVLCCSHSMRRKHQSPWTFTARWHQVKMGIE